MGHVPKDGKYEPVLGDGDGESVSFGKQTCARAASFGGIIEHQKRPMDSVPESSRRSLDPTRTRVTREEI